MKRLFFVLMLFALVMCNAQTTTHRSRVKVKKAPTSTPTDNVMARNATTGLLTDTGVPVSDLTTGGGGDPGLIPVDEGNGEGFRLKNLDPANSANVGEGGIDLSANQGANTTFGATGGYAIAHGTDVTASGSISTVLSSFQGTATGYGNVVIGSVFNTNVTASQGGGAYSVSRGQNAGTYSAIIGGDENVIHTGANKSVVAGGDSNNSYNIRQFLWGRWSRARNENEGAGGMYNVDEPVDNTLTARLFSIGNGTSPTNRSDAFTIRRNGEVTGPSMTTALIEGNPKSFITYDYFTANSGLTLEGYLESGTAIGADLEVRIGDHSEGNNGTQIIVSDATGEITIGAPTQTTISGSAEIRDATFDLGIGGSQSQLNTTALTGNRVHNLPDQSGTIALLTDIPAGGTPTGLEVIDEGNGNGWRLIGRNANNYGDIGQNATDLSFSNSSSTTKGSTGQWSFATGQNTTAEGLWSFAGGLNAVAEGAESLAFGADVTATSAGAVALGRLNNSTAQYTFTAGFQNNASGNGSNALGQTSTASGEQSTAIGRSTFARSPGEVMVGYFGVDYTPSSNINWVATDRQFVVANGSTVTPRNAFTIYKNGSAVLTPTSKASITNAEAGMFIMDSDEGNKLKFYDGTAWQEVSFVAD